jgi:UDP:flavonoid glycosyltransferase YjiC (YdhE family)
MHQDKRPLRFLFAMFQGGGNIPLIMPIVAELVGRGHDVRILAGPGVRLSRMPVSDGWRKRIQDAGATLVPLIEPPDPPYATAPPLRGLAFGWMPKQLVPYARDQARTTLWSTTWANNVTEQARASAVDAVVADYWLPGAIAAAEAAGTPCAVIVHNAFPPKATGHPPKGSGFMPARSPIERLRHALWRWPHDRLWLRDGLPAHNLARDELGLPPLRSVFDEFGRANRALILGYKEFDFPANVATNVRYVGTPIDDMNAADGSWSSPWPADDARPLVLVSLSTLRQGQAPTMHRILEAIDGMPVRAMVTLGPSLNRDEFSAPANMVFETFVPHSAVLPHVAAAITQCGLGTFTKALRHGVPLVCMPILGDQPDNAARIVAYGAGLRLSPDAPAGQIRAALTRVIEEPRFREAAARFGSMANAAPAGEVAAADELERVAQTAG